jgi:chemotaxis methyl-accepting protein methylase
VDALVGTGLADRASLHLSAIDINPRVVQWLEGTHGTAPELALYAGVRESEQVHLTDDYRSYFSSLGKSIGVSRPMRGLGSRQLSKTVTLFSDVTAAVDAATVDITVERVDDRYDLIVVTNVFPYLSDAELLLALGNVVQMLKPGGVLLHNEPRPLLANATLALGLPLIHSRSAVVATVDGGPPLYDAVWMHKAP